MSEGKRFRDRYDERARRAIVGAVACAADPCPNASRARRVPSGISDTEPATGTIRPAEAFTESQVILSLIAGSVPTRVR
jgi:hypothetical protein